MQKPSYGAELLVYQAVCKIALFGDGEFDSLLRHATTKYGSVAQVG